jgi:serine/threonine protein kinase
VIAIERMRGATCTAIDDGEAARAARSRATRTEVIRATPREATTRRGSADDAHLADGHLLGTRWLVLRMLGHGGMGEVYEVEHRDLGRRAAVKVLHRRHAGRADLAARLRAEARLAASFEHPNLVEAFDLGTTTDGRPWFAMPLLRGRDLRDELTRRGPAPASVAASIAVGALRGLGAAHEAGFVHRDVKLENLLLETSGNVRVLDFGVAKPLHRIDVAATPTAPSPGTPRSMAPEQSGSGVVDARCDVYAMGLALYELLTGRGPFDDVRGNDHALRYAHTARQPAAPSTCAPSPVPPGLDAIVLRALAKEPSQRFASARAMAAALQPFARPAPHRSAAPGGL